MRTQKIGIEMDCIWLSCITAWGTKGQREFNILIPFNSSLFTMMLYSRLCFGFGTNLTIFSIHTFLPNNISPFVTQIKINHELSLEKS